MVFNHFVKFVLEHGVNRRRQTRLNQLSLVGVFVFYVFALVMFGRSPGLVAMLLLGAVLAQAGIAYAINQHLRNRARAKIPAELTEVWNTIEWLLRRGELSSRTHPQLLSHLEMLAETRQKVKRVLQGEAWRARRSTPEGLQVVASIEHTLDEAIYDSLFIGRGLFRGPNQRASTFDRRSADPAFGASALASVEQIRAAIESLASSAIAADDSAVAPIAQIEARIAEIVRAEREVAETVGPPLDFDNPY